MSAPSSKSCRRSDFEDLADVPASIGRENAHVRKAHTLGVISAGRLSSPADG
jgi:hypothetical protein